MADQLPVFSTQKYEIPADSHNFLVPSENSAFGIPVPCLQFKIAFKKIPTLCILKTTPICRKKRIKTLFSLFKKRNVILRITKISKENSM